MRFPIEARHVKHAVVGGTAAGLVAGFVMQLMLLAMAAANARPIEPVFKAAAAPLLGARVLSSAPDVPALLLGVLLFYAVAVAWGVLFALVVDGAPFAVTLVAGVVWGMGVWLVMHWLVLPAMGMGLAASEMQQLPTTALQHALYGLSLGAAYLAFQHRRHRVLRRPYGDVGSIKHEEYGWFRKGDAPAMSDDPTTA